MLRQVQCHSSFSLRAKINHLQHNARDRTRHRTAYHPDTFERNDRKYAKAHKERIVE